MRVIAVAFAALVLAACQTTAPRTVASECRIFEGPPHAVQTVTRASQLWADETISIGIRVCGWDRPGAPSPDEVLVQIGSGRWLPDARSLRVNSLRPILRPVAVEVRADEPDDARARRVFTGLQLVHAGEVAVADHLRELCLRHAEGLAGCADFSRGQRGGSGSGIHAIGVDPMENARKSCAIPSTCTALRRS